MKLPRELRPLARLRILKRQVFEKLDTLLSGSETLLQDSTTRLENDAALVDTLRSLVQVLQAERAAAQQRHDQLLGELRKLEARIEARIGRLSDRTIGIAAEIQTLAPGISDSISHTTRLDEKIARLLARLGVFEPSPDQRGAGSLADRITLDGVLYHLRGLGFAPRAIMEVGATSGGFCRLAAALFPEARIVVFGRSPEHVADLDRLSIECRRVTFRAGTSGGVTVTSLDGERQALALEAPILLKVDAEGRELDVLAGAKGTLDDCDVVILTAGLRRSVPATPLLHEVIAFMADSGFCVHDIAEPVHRPVDGALVQVDVAFVRDKSPLRRTPGPRSSD
jgi:hypothetical protein